MRFFLIRLTNVKFYDTIKGNATVKEGSALTATNITELIWCEEIEVLLRFCGVNENEIAETASDYEKFRALCNAIPLLYGHSLPIKLTRLLKDRFDLEAVSFSEDCDRVWHGTAKILLQNPMPSCSLLPKYTDRKITLDLPPIVEAFTEDILCGNDLLQTQAGSWLAWQNELSQRLDAFGQGGGRLVFLRLSQEACCKHPDVYHVELALQSRQDTALLEAQLLRCLSVECQRKDMTLVLQIDACAEATDAMLTRTEKRVGIPKLILMASQPEGYGSIWCFQAKPHRKPVRFAVPLQTNHAELARIATRYPLKRVLLIDTETLNIYRFL